MICPKCGTPAEDPNASFCSVCGSPLAETTPARPAEQPVHGAENAAQQNNPAMPPAGLTRSEFYKEYAPKAARSNIIAAGVLSYISAALTLVLAFAIMFNPFVLVDFAIVLGLGLGVHIGKSRVCAILLMAYAVYNTIFFLVTSGNFAGWLILIAGLCAILGTFSFAKAWEEYKGSLSQ